MAGRVTLAWPDHGLIVKVQGCLAGLANLTAQQNGWKKQGYANNRSFVWSATQLSGYNSGPLQWQEASS